MIYAAIPEFLAALPAGTRTPCHGRGDLFTTTATGDDDPTAYAKALCAACPIRQACADHAIRRGESDGIWGGLTPAERAKLARRRPPCGTDAGWRSHFLRGESCLTCREAHAERARDQRLKRLAHEHAEHGGSLTGYRLERLLGLPTCVRCRAARQEYYADRPSSGKWYRRTAA
ncbi:WhiB family transcriptional regulator [Streptomyces sp. NPDC000927]|uniref:WhiB family transcriptional regulator n=1 Tax=Streptomyces sp. NPDC000927 TaxID=3154371 RepID=UPI00331A636C